MTTVDWVAVAVICVSAVVGYRRGLIASGLSLAGVIAGAIIGARIAPHLLRGGSHSPYTPLAALIGATLGAGILQTAGSTLGSLARGSTRMTPFRTVDSIGGFLLGAAAGLAIVWVLGAVALLVPDRPGLRRVAQDSEILDRLNHAIPPRKLLNALARIDPFPSIVTVGPPPAAPDPSVRSDPQIEDASASVVRVLGTACGIGVQGTGWLARPGLIVTAAHVVAGQTDTVVETANAEATYRAQTVVFDAKNDVAVLRVEGFDATPLPLRSPETDAPAALLGFPGNGPLHATPVRIGRTRAALSEDAYGHGPVRRTVTVLSGHVEHGDSGGPAVDRNGAVQVMVFAASRLAANSGYGVPSDVVESDLGRARGVRSASTGDCPT